MILICQRCEYDRRDAQPSCMMEVAKRACGSVLCDDCYKEHLDHDPSVGIFRCTICYGAELEVGAEFHAEWRREERWG